MRFWNDIADDPPVVASAEIFARAASTMLRLLGEGIMGWFTGGSRLRALMARGRIQA